MKLTNHERARKAAAARWGGERSKGVRIYVDEDVAIMLANYRASEKRRIASEAIRKAVSNGLR